VLQLCERVVGPNKGRYDEIAKAVLSVVYDKVTKDFETHLADHWLLCADFWQESKIRHLDEQQAFFVFLTGLHNPDYLKSHL
jgi:hypothetical protein